MTTVREELVAEALEVAGLGQSGDSPDDLVPHPNGHLDTAGRFAAEWPDDMIEIAFDHFDRTRAGLYGEITVTVRDQIIHGPGIRFNLSATAAISTLAKHLDHIEKRDWQLRIEYARRAAYEVYERGDELVSITAGGPVVPVDWIVPRFLQFKQPTLVFAPAGSGKSYLAGAIACSLAIGEPIIRPLPATRSMTVAYLDWEADLNEHGARIGQILAGVDLPPDAVEVFYRRMVGPLTNSISSLRRQFSDLGVEFVVVDSAGPACGGIPESAEPTLSFFEALRSLNCTSLVLAHVAKNSEKTSAFGSVFWTNIPRTVIEVAASQDENESELRIGMYYRKVNHGRRPTPLGISIGFDGDEGPVTFKSAEVLDDPELAKRGSVISQLLYCLRRGRMTVAALEQETGIKENTIYKTLNRDRGRKVGKYGSEWGVLDMSSDSVQ